MFKPLALIVLLAVAGSREPVSANRDVPSGARIPDPGSRRTVEDDASIVHILNRLTYGPRPGDVERVRSMGLQKWIELQLTPSRIDNRALDARLQRLETLTTGDANRDMQADPPLTAP